MPSVRRLAAAAVVLAALVAPVAGAREAAAAGGARPCTHELGPARRAALARALADRRDVWGERLLAAPGGPSLAAVRRALPPLRYARGHAGRPLTRSGVYYLALGMPASLYGEKGFGLHVADGSEVLSRRVDGPGIRLLVGSDGREPFGSCAARSAPAQLGEGFLPVLRTHYVDAAGARYAETSFASDLPPRGVLASLVRIEVDATRSRAPVEVRALAERAGGLRPEGRDRLVDARGRARLVTDGDAALDSGGAVWRVARGSRRVVTLAWLDGPAAITDVRVDDATYAAERARVERFWRAQLARGAEIEVPEPAVEDALRDLLIQQVLHTWRYSVGNPYEELSFAEALDDAEVMAAYGRPDVATAIVRFARERLAARFSSWRAGEVLAASATLERLSPGPARLDEATPQLATTVARLARAIGRPGTHGLLPREPYSTDVARPVFGLHGQATVWRGLETMAAVWERAGDRSDAALARRTAARLGRALRRAVAASERTLPDGSLFVPTALLDGQAPFDRIAASRDGSYWNLVVPYALASGLFPPHGRVARGSLAYLDGHGATLLGLVRAGAYRLYGPGQPTAETGGTDEVYGLERSRFLADEDLPDRLVLSLYGMLGAAMTPGTFVSGEAESVSPLGHDAARTMHLPPNAGANAAFLETLHLMLAHETRRADGTPLGLQLAFATPRRWLARGARISVRGLLTSFGPLTYSLTRRGDVVHVLVDPPARIPPRRLELRLRLPDGEHVRSVRTSTPGVRLERATGVLDLPPHDGPLQLTVAVG